MSKELQSMREYEILVISEIADALHSEARAKTKSILESYKAEIFEDKDFGIHDLSYPIKKVKQGKYFFYHFRLEDSSSIVTIERDLRYEESVLRFIIVRLDEVQKKIDKSNIKREKHAKREEARRALEERNNANAESSDQSANA